MMLTLKLEAGVENTDALSKCCLTTVFKLNNEVFQTKKMGPSILHREKKKKNFKKCNRNIKHAVHLKGFRQTSAITGKLATTNV